MNSSVWGPTLTLGIFTMIEVMILRVMTSPHPFLQLQTIQSILRSRSPQDGPTCSVWVFAGFQPRSRTCFASVLTAGNAPQRCAAAALIETLVLHIIGLMATLQPAHCPIGCFAGL